MWIIILLVNKIIYIYYIFRRYESIYMHVCCACIRMYVDKASWKSLQFCVDH